MNEINKDKIKIQLLKKLDIIFSGCKLIYSNKDALLWVKRIIMFIENELSNTFQYQNFLKNFQDFINKKGKLKFSYRDTQNYCGALFLDLFAVVKNDSFDEYSIKFHPKVEEVSHELFKDGHYSQAIFEAVKTLNNYVKDKANITDADLFSAMGKAFKVDKPIIKLNKLVSLSDKDEQDGFRFLFQGAMRAIRNPKAHDTHKLKDRNKAIEYLAFLSLLFRKTDEGEL